LAFKGGSGDPIFLRSTMSMTTLPLGPSWEDPSSLVQKDLEMATKCDKSLADFLFGNDLAMLDDPIEKHVSNMMQWIKVRAPQVPPLHAPGHVEAIAEIWRLIRTHDVGLEDLNKFREEHDNLCQHIPKAKEHQLIKMGGRSGVVSSTVRQKIEEWANQKILASHSKVSSQESAVVEMHKAAQVACDKVLSSILGSYHTPQPHDDIDDSLMAELDDFMNMNFWDGDGAQHEPPVEPPVEPTVLDAPTLALSYVMSLEDGPQKSALMAVLEVAQTTPKVGSNQITFVGSPLYS